MQALLHTLSQPLVPPVRASDARRVFHGRGGLYPGCEHLTLDAYGPVWLLTSFAPLTEADLATVHDALAHAWAQLPHSSTGAQPLCWVYQCRHAEHRCTRLMAGTLPDPHVVTEPTHALATATPPGADADTHCDALRYTVHLLRGQNHGLFLDMAEGRAWVHAHARTHAHRHPGLKVLNLFAYTCAFSVAALHGGAAQVVNVDMSQGALATGRQNHQLNGLAGASFLAHDIFNSWGKLTRGGPYDLIVADPPSYQKGSFIATKDYARLVRRLPDLLMPGGHALLCLNAPELGPDFLHDTVRTHASELQLVARLPNPAAFADTDPNRALKVMLYRLP